MDFEMAFATQEDVFKVIEKVIPVVFKTHTNWDVTEGPFVRIPYAEAIAFPKNKKARDVMMNAPSVVTDRQLEDVHIRVTEQEEENK